MKIIKQDLEIHNNDGICIVSAHNTDDVLELNYLKYIYNKIENMSEEKEEVEVEVVANEYIQFDDLMKVDIRVCEVKEAIRVPKTDKLLQLTINTGTEERISITNIGEFLEPETLIGKKIPFVLNLPPMKMRGVLTTAMIFISSDSNGINIPNLDCEVGATYLK
jgi:methionyl-tRNA synthetase